MGVWGKPRRGEAVVSNCNRARGGCAGACLDLGGESAGVATGMTSSTSRLRDECGSVVDVALSPDSDAGWASANSSSVAEWSGSNLPGAPSTLALAASYMLRSRARCARS